MKTCSTSFCNLIRKKEHVELVPSAFEIELICYLGDRGGLVVYVTDYGLRVPGFERWGYEPHWYWGVVHPKKSLTGILTTKQAKTLILQ